MSATTNLRKGCLALLILLTLTASSLEAGVARSRRTQALCGATLLGVATVASTWVLDAALGPTPGKWRDDFSVSSNRGRHVYRALNSYFYFAQGGLPYTEVEILQTGWWSNQVADRIKAKLVKEFPRAAELPEWEKPGLRVPLSVVSFEMDDQDSTRAYVELTGPFLTLVSEQSIPVKELESGSPQTVQFKHRRTDALQQGIELHFDFEFRFDPQVHVVDEVQMRGKLRAFGPLFEYEDKFTTGPLTAHPEMRVAER